MAISTPVTDARSDAAADTTPVDGLVEAPVDEFLLDELLVEEISIDGMCGVY